MDAKLVANYLVKKTAGTDLTYEIVAERSKRSLSTVKNLYSGKTEDPRLDTVAPVVYAVGGSLDELYCGKIIDEVKDNINIHDLRLRETIEHYENRLADKNEIIERQDKHINTLIKRNMSSTILSWICIAVLVGLLIAEVMNPNLGWLRF